MRLDTTMSLNDGGGDISQLDKGTLRRFREARHRSKRRMGRDRLQNHEFLKLLLDVWEEYEEPKRCDHE